MMQRIGVIAGTAALVVTTSLLSAQQPKGQGRPGLQALAGAGGGRLLAMPEVQKELGLSDEQKKKVEELLKELGMSEADRQSFRSLSKEERRERLKEAARKGQENAGKAKEAVKSILDAKQLERFNQLVLQREGAAALARPDVAEKLGLTQEQKDKLGNIVKDALPDQGSLPDLKNASKEDRRAAFTKMREKAEKAKADGLAVLTPEQKEPGRKCRARSSISRSVPAACSMVGGPRQRVRSRRGGDSR
ncbi:MAG: hypothetical protein HY000_19295 [Planctomycetes bacterium]|nr:hypothetical protein [Planctomycetota bacterium]